jgi:Ser/Thr protein kinase RdoA (MazF antagonist)
LDEKINRKDILVLWKAKGLKRAASLYGTSDQDLNLYEDYIGCQNVVYDYARDGTKLILRISYREDRTLELVQAEIDFVNYLAGHGVRVSRVLPSLDGNLMEVIQVDGCRFLAVSFEKARGMRVPDNQYRYRAGAPIEEYCQNWGQFLGQMHRLTRQYVSPDRVTGGQIFSPFFG